MHEWHRLIFAFDYNVVRDYTFDISFNSLFYIISNHQEKTIKRVMYIIKSYSDRDPSLDYTRF